MVSLHFQKKYYILGKSMNKINNKVFKTKIKKLIDAEKPIIKIFYRSIAPKFLSVGTDVSEPQFVCGRVWPHNAITRFARHIFSSIFFRR